MAELEDQIQADIAGLEAEFATQQQQILNEEKINKKIAIRGVYALRDLKKNEILNYKKLYFARPSGSLAPDFLDKKIIKLRRNISKNKKIQKKDIF